MTVVEQSDSKVEDSRTSSNESIYASAASNESRGRTKARDSNMKVRSSNTIAKPTTKRRVILPFFQRNDQPCSLYYYNCSGYHTFTAFGREFCVEKRWKLVRELGSGAYGCVV